MEPKILIIGAGPVGLSTAIGFAYRGYNVVCYDIDKERMEALRSGVSPIYEFELQNYIDLLKNNLKFVDDPCEAFAETNMYFIAVGTPLGNNNNVDMSAFWSAVSLIEKHVCRDSIIVIKSTVPIGTNKKVRQYITRSAIPYKIDVISNPEFLAQGTSVSDTINATRIVIGYNNEDSRDAILEVYKGFDCEKVVTTPESAELIKYESNCYLAMRVSFVNDLAVICDLVGADIRAVVKGLSLDPRIGDLYFSPSSGYGRSCFPKDTVCFHQQMQTEYGHELELIEATVDINKRQSLLLCRKIVKRHGNLFEKNICVLGLSFKKNTDDVRNSLAVDIISYFIDNGANVVTWDPVAEHNGRKIFGNRIKYASNIEEAVNGNDIVLIATDWNEIVNMPLSLLKGKSVYDGRNCLLGRLDDIDFEYTYIGGCNKYAK